MAAITDKFTKVGSPGSATTLSAPGYTIGNTTINVAATTNWPTVGEKVYFAIDRAEVVSGSEVRIAGTYNEFEGLVSAAGVLSNISKTYGTAQDYVAGALTRVYIPVASSRENALVDGLDQDHSLKGNHKDLTDDNDNEWLERGQTTNAVNQVKVSNAATGDAPVVEASGGDTNIDLRTKAKGTGTYQPGKPVSFRAYRNASLSVSDTLQKIELDAEDFDYGSNFDASTNYRFDAPYDGVYQFDAGVRFTNLDAEGDSLIIYIHKNGSTQVMGAQNTASLAATDDLSAVVSGCVELAANDYIELWVDHSSASSETLAVGSSLFTYMSGHLVGRTD